MAKVGIITFHYGTNYGALIQAYALMQAVDKLGHNAVIIDYQPRNAKKFYKDYFPLNPAKWLKSSTYHAWKKNKQFKLFKDKYFNLKYKASSNSELADMNLDLDCVITGSDQVWNINSYRGCDPAFYLDFIGQKNIKRISYAASLGNTSDYREHKNNVSDWLSKFSAISVREKTSIEIVQQLTNMDIVQVLDPVFLADFSTITPKPIIKQPYILFYLMEYSDFNRNAIKAIENRFKLPSVVIGKKYKKMNYISANPSEWLSLLKHAHFVATDSFHGTCFSILNKKDFVTLPHTNKSSRHKDILNTAGLNDRFASNINELENCLNNKINFSLVENKISLEINRSMEFLRNAIE